MTAAEPRWWLAAALAFGSFAVLGSYVSRRTPLRIDVEAVALRGMAPGPAAFFTRLGYWPSIAGVTALAAAGAAATHADVVSVALLAALQVITQAAIMLAKLAYRRTRPDYWVIRKEADLSFPSGHAATAVVLYAGLAMLVAHAAHVPAAVRVPVAVALAVCTIGIPWSRLALGAHYVTDIAGGLLFGTGAWCAAAALMAHAAGVHQG